MYSISTLSQTNCESEIVLMFRYYSVKVYYVFVIGVQSANVRTAGYMLVVYAWCMDVCVYVCVCVRDYM